MRRSLVLLAFVSVCCLSASADVGLADWCVNDNGSVGAGSNQPSNSCNGGTLAPDPNVNIGSFDQTLEPGANAVATTPQSIMISFGTGPQNIGVFLNYDVDFAAFGSNGDYGTPVGAFPAPFSYEMDNEFASTIFSDFAGGAALPDTNNVDFATCSANFPPNYCDVAMSMNWIANIDATKFTGGTITYTASTTKPTSAFYLEQTSGLSCQASGGTGAGCANVFLSASVSLTPVGGGGNVPEPNEVVLLLGMLSVIVIAVKKKKQQLS